MVEYALDYFEKYDIDYPSKIIFTGNAITSRKIIKSFLKTVDRENLTVLSAEDYREEVEDTEIFTRYSPLVMDRIKTQEGRKCIVFDNIVYHPRQILPLFVEVSSAEDILFFQSKHVIEDNIKFDTVFVVSYDEENIRKIHGIYNIDIPIQHFCDIVRDCIEQGDCFVLKIASGEFSLNYYCEE